LKDTFIGIKTTSLGIAFNISFFISMQFFIDVETEAACPKFLNSFNLLWWVHLISAIFPFINYLLNKIKSNEIQVLASIFSFKVAIGY
jgi:hypothetical protein